MPALTAPRLLDRLATGISLSMLIALGLFSIYLAQRAESERQRPPPAAPDPRQADYFVDRLTLFTLDPQGAPGWRIQALALRHYPADDSAHFEQPVMASLDPTRPGAKLRADHGRWWRYSCWPFHRHVWRLSRTGWHGDGCRRQYRGGACWHGECLDFLPAW